MAWTTPKTNWATGELVTAADLNAICENLAALKNPPTASGATTQDKYTPWAFGDIDSDNLNLTITTTGGHVLIHLGGSVRNHSDAERAAHAFFDFDIDGQRQGGANGIIEVVYSGGYEKLSIVRLIQHLNAGTHTFKPQWRKIPDRRHANARLNAGAQFWVREI